MSEKDIGKTPDLSENPHISEKSGKSQFRPTRTVDASITSPSGMIEGGHKIAQAVGRLDWQSGNKSSETSDKRSHEIRKQINELDRELFQQIGIDSRKTKEYFAGLEQNVTDQKILLSTDNNANLHSEVQSSALLTNTITEIPNISSLQYRTTETPGASFSVETSSLNADPYKAYQTLHSDSDNKKSREQTILNELRGPHKSSKIDILRKGINKINDYIQNAKTDIDTTDAYDLIQDITSLVFYIDPSNSIRPSRKINNDADAIRFINRIDANLNRLTQDQSDRKAVSRRDIIALYQIFPDKPKN